MRIYTIYQTQHSKQSIIYDDYGLGISDGWEVIRPFIYEFNRQCVYDFPELILKHVRKVFERLAERGEVANKMSDTDLQKYSYVEV